MSQVATTESIVVALIIEKGSNMENSRRRLLPLISLAVLLFGIGVRTLTQFSPHVRAVEAVGLVGAGFSLGVGFILLVFGISGRMRS
jgi:hypothetical protein